MRRLLLAAAILAASSAVAFAHPPVRIVSKVVGPHIETVIAHPVEDPRAHYIDRVEVRLNGQRTIEQRFSLQTGNEQRAVYLIPSLKDGDRLDVIACCNIAGKLIQGIIIGPPPQPPSPAVPGAGAEGPAGIDTGGAAVEEAKEE